MLAENLKRLRNNKGLSKRTVARDLGVHDSTYGKYELGHREPDLETTQKLANYFNVTVDELLGRVDERSSVQSESVLKAKERVMNILDKRNMTLDDLLVGIYPQYQLNDGFGTPELTYDDNDLTNIAEFLNIPYDYLAGLSDDEPPDESYPELVVPEILKGTLIAFDNGDTEGLTQSEVDAIASIVAALKRRKKPMNNDET